MNKHCGQTKFLFSAVLAALFSLTLAAPQSSAQNIKLGPGVEDPCYDGDNGGVPTAAGWCDIADDEVNAILGDTMNWYQNSTPGVENIVSPLFLIFAVPVENLLFPFFGGDEFNGPVTGSALTNPGTLVDTDPACFPDCSAELAAGSAVGVDFPMNSDFPISFSNYFDTAPNMFPDSFPGGFEQGTLYAEDELGADGLADANTSVYDFMGLPANSVSNKIGRWQDLSQEIPAIVLGGEPEDFIRPSGWNLWVFLLDHHDELDAKESIQLMYDEAQLPLGTWVVGWAIGEKCTGQETPTADPGANPEAPGDCDQKYFGMAVTEDALLMPIPETTGTPEPTSLLLLGTGLLAIGKKLRKRQKGQDQNVT